MPKTVQLQACASVSDANWSSHHSNRLNARIARKPEKCSHSSLIDGLEVR
jgi:hypothetical protein